VLQPEDVSTAAAASGKGGGAEQANLEAVLAAPAAEVESEEEYAEEERFQDDQAVQLQRAKELKLTTELELIRTKLATWAAENGILKTNAVASFEKIRMVCGGVYGVWLCMVCVCVWLVERYHLVCMVSSVRR
jgi:hypothetical protein